MPIGDPAAALALIDEALADLRAHRRIYDRTSMRDDYYRAADYRELDEKIEGRVPALVAIAAAVHEDIAHQVGSPGGSYQWDWTAHYEGLIRLRGAIESADQVAAIIAPAGPQLAAARLHDWVWTAAARLWAGEHRRSAVQTAATHVETQLRAKIDRHDVAEASKLPGEAFSLEAPAPGRPRLRLPDVGEEGSARWKAAHEGALHFGRGCFQGIRNLASHTTDELGEQEALEYLAALSVFARWVDTAVRFDA